MKKKFKELKIGERFILPDPRASYYGEPEVLEKIPFMENYYRTTGYKRNARWIHGEKYFYVDDDQEVEVVES